MFRNDFAGMPAGCAAALAALTAITLALALQVNLALANKPGSKQQAAGPQAVDWNQHQHDAARTGRSEALGPVNPTIVDGWPADCANCLSGVSSAELSTDSGNSKRVNIVGTSYVQTLFGFGADGQPLPGLWPVVLGPRSTGGHLSQPAISTRSGNGTVFTTRHGTSLEDDQPATVFAVGLDGHPVKYGHWPVTFPHRFDEAPTDPALAKDTASTSSDVGSGETVYVTSSNFTTGYGLLHALSSDGSEKPGWPARIALTLSTNDPAVAPNDGSAYVMSVGCWNGFAYACAGVFGFTPDGKPKQGWPHEFEQGRMAMWSGLSVDRDGTVYTATTGDEAFYNGLYYAFNPDGTIAAGNWPARVIGTPFGTPSIAADGVTYMSTVDPDNADVRIYAFDEAGNQRPSWPITVPSSLRPPNPWWGPAFSNIIVDRDGNIFFGSKNTLYALDSKGKALPGWPIQIKGISSTNELTLTNDGTLYLLGANSRPEENKIYALRSGGS